MDYFDDNGDLVWESTELDDWIHQSLIDLGLIQRRVDDMQNGTHKHYCHLCKQDYVCPLVTHCKRGDTWECPDCAFKSYNPDFPFAPNPRRG